MCLRICTPPHHVWICMVCESSAACTLSSGNHIWHYPRISTQRECWWLQLPQRPNLCSPAPSGLRRQTPSLPLAHCSTMLLGSSFVTPHLHAGNAKTHYETKQILFRFSFPALSLLPSFATLVPSLCATECEITGGLVEASGDISCHSAWKMISLISGWRQ